MTQELMGQIETALAQEAGTARGYNFANSRHENKRASSQPSYGVHVGNLHLVPSVASDAAWGAGMESKPSDDWVSKRFGMAPPLPMVELRSRAELSILAAAGVPTTDNEHVGWDGEERRLQALFAPNLAARGPHHRAADRRCPGS